ncbi:hypothetical protein [Streptomyces sp. cmx-18-6]|uniref:hypothetical protein n=1 Tax=Streptomyces sp. cmx-18-6 TaxID=2790930 RepID=UPI0039803A37
MPRTARSAAAVTLAASLALTGAALTAPAAHAAPKIDGFANTMHRDGSRTITVRLDGKVGGKVTWNADKHSTGNNRNGDTVYITDSAGDGYYIRAEVIVAGTGKSVVNHTSRGHKAPVTVSKGKNIAENTKLKFRACMGKGGYIHGCTKLYDAKS